MLILKRHTVRNPSVRRRIGTQSNIDGLCDLPKLKDNAEALTEKNHPRSVFIVVKQVEKDDSLHEDVGEDGTDGDADVVFFVTPVGLVSIRLAAPRN